MDWVIISGGSRGARDAPGSKCLHFRVVFGENWSNSMLEIGQIVG